MQRHPSMQRHIFRAAGSFALLLGSAYAAHAQTTIVYSNETNFTGYSFSNGGATTAKKNTYLIADDINTLAGSGGQSVVSLDFSLANTSTVAISVSPTLDFYAANGTGGNPGTLLASDPLSSISVPSGVGLYTYAPGGTIFTLPTSGSFWAGITFTSATATAAQLNKIGQGIFNPPVVGTSQDLLFESTATGTFGASNPAGAQYASPFGGAPVANFGWQFLVNTPAISAAPEPSAWAGLAFTALGLGALCVRARKRQTA